MFWLATTKYTTKERQIHHRGHGGHRGGTEQIPIGMSKSETKTKHEIEKGTGARRARKKNSDRWNNVWSRRPENIGFWRGYCSTTVPHNSSGARIEGRVDKIEARCSKVEGSRNLKFEVPAGWPTGFGRFVTIFSNNRFVGRNSEILSPRRRGQKVEESKSPRVKGSQAGSSW